MTPQQRIEWQRDIQEIFGIEDEPIVSLPQFVIDRVKPCVDAMSDGLTMMGALMWVNGEDGYDAKLEDDREWWEYRPSGIPKLLPAFVKWRDTSPFEQIRQMQIMLALIYNYKLEEIPGQTELILEDKNNG